MHFFFQFYKQCLVPHFKLRNLFFMCRLHTAYSVYIVFLLCIYEIWNIKLHFLKLHIKLRNITQNIHIAVLITVCKTLKSIFGKWMMVLGQEVVVVIVLHQLFYCIYLIDNTTNFKYKPYNYVLLQSHGVLLLQLPT